MAHLSQGIEMGNMEGTSGLGHSRSTSYTGASHLLPNVLEGDADAGSITPSINSTFSAPLLERTEYESHPPTIANAKEAGEAIAEPRKAAVDDRRWTAFPSCLPHVLPLGTTIAVLALNITGVFWQDLGEPHQNNILQALQYVAKAHEIMMAASLASIAVHRLQYDLTTSKGVPLGFLSAGYQLSDPLLFLTKEFWGGAISRTHPSGISRFFPYGYLLVLGFGLTALVGPSSAIAMIPRLDWWNVPTQQAFGDINDRLYLNRTYKELWPADITTGMYANTSGCDNSQSLNSNCALSAMSVILPWTHDHQSQGLKPNITVSQRSEVIRYLTSQSGPPDTSGWTITSTVPYQLAQDLGRYWEWLVENATLPGHIKRPLIQPSFKDRKYQMRKPLVQAECKSYSNPDFEHDDFDFPHQELKTPPLDGFLAEKWTLPNEFVKQLIGNNSAIGDYTDSTHPFVLFDWYDTANNFSNAGAPSLGAVVIYSTHASVDGKNSAHYTNLATCTFDGRWTPFVFHLDPKEDPTIRQNSPNPMDILNGPQKADLKDLTQMKIHLEWANLLNVKSRSPYDPAATTVEEVIEALGAHNYDRWDVFPEPERDGPWVMTSIDWRLSTVLGLCVTEGLARAYVDDSGGSIVYRDALAANQSYARSLNDLNIKTPVEGWENYTLEWVAPIDSRWNASIPSFDVWAPQHGYTEIAIAIQRYGYGYGFGGVPIKLATVALVVYSVLVMGHMLVVFLGGQTFKSWSGMSELLALAWNSTPTPGLQNASAGIEKIATWKQVVRVREKDGKRLRLVLENQNEKTPSWKPRPGAKYS
ncbi:MAG: hypothetical protein LQ342_004166 [Letrouitia transgressa]|nr:MAG: hypothetical protein LQ342_004166 [Letrouitia transgressa]